MGDRQVMSDERQLGGIEVVFIAIDDEYLHAAPGWMDVNVLKIRDVLERSSLAHFVIILNINIACSP